VSAVPIDLGKGDEATQQRGTERGPGERGCAHRASGKKFEKRERGKKFVGTVREKSSTK